MLTLRDPIQLQIGAGLAVHADGFCQRIAGNYDLMRARFAPKDLLFLMTAPPELPDTQPSMTTLVAQTNLTDASSVVVDVVNHVVNRILLDGSSHFTYQDQVYITTVLNRLGITQVEPFIRQVRLLRTQTESVSRLNCLYREQLQQLVLRQAAGEPVPQLPLPVTDSTGEVSARDQEPSQSLYAQIFNRLDTARIYASVHAFHRSYSIGGDVIQNQTFRLAEQLRVSQQLQLSQLKQQIYQSDAVDLQHINHYETGELLEPPENPEAVLTQAAAAALVNVVDRAVTTRLMRQTHQRDQWLRLERAVRQTAENTLVRFETYHRDGPPLRQQAPDVTLQPGRSFYLQELHQFYDFYRHLHTEQAATLPPLPSLTLTQTQLIQQLQAQIETDAAYPVIDSQPLRQMTQLTQELASQTIWEHLSSQQSEIPAEKSPLSPPQLIMDQTQKSQQSEEPQQNTEGVRTATVAPHLIQQQLTQLTRELASQTILEQMFPLRPAQAAAKALFPLPGDAPITAQTLIYHTAEQQPIQLLPEPSMHERLVQTQETAVPPPAPMVQRQSPDSETVEASSAQTLQEELTRIDRQNRTLLQTLKEQLPQTSPALPRPDPRRTMSEALRALQSPETVLREYFSAPSAPTMTHTEIPPEIQTILQHADPATRTLYETVLRYQRDPEAVLSQGLLRQGNLGSLNAALKQAEVPAAVELTHEQHELYRELSPQQANSASSEDTSNSMAQQQTRQFHQQSELVLEYLQQLPDVRQTVVHTQSAPPSSVHIVHKQAQMELDETFLEQLQQRQTQTVLKTQSSENTVHQHHKVEQIEHQNQVVTQTTEDITALINRTLSRQMRTITDQVYHQMEKRLQNERSRRGRF